MPVSTESWIVNVLRVWRRFLEILEGSSLLYTFVLALMQFRMKVCWRHPLWCFHEYTAILCSYVRTWCETYGAHSAVLSVFHTTEMSFILIALASSSWHWNFRTYGVFCMIMRVRNWAWFSALSRRDPSARSEYHHAVTRIIKTLCQHIYFSLELLDEWGFCYQPANAEADE